MIDKLIGTLRMLDWHIIEKKKAFISLRFLLERYGELPEEFTHYLKSIETGTSPDKNVWLLCEAEYNGNSDDEFRWNELELLSLESACDDISWQNRIKTFWNNHLPFILSVKGEYSYFAIGVGEANYGQIFYGMEPEFEEVTLVADSLNDFISKLEKQALLPEKDYPYNLFF